MITDQINKKLKGTIWHLMDVVTSKRKKDYCKIRISKILNSRSFIDVTFISSSSTECFNSFLNWAKNEL
jgi:hypothetical protein